MTNLVQSFQYSPLETPDTIRVVILTPGVEGTEIDCAIRHISLEEPVPYYALSYVWGDPNSRRNIRLDGHLFQVTENLYAFLEMIRDGYETVWHEWGNHDALLTFWIDAICINQRDIPEKNQQVQRMKQIYGRAARVVAWLGAADEYSEISFSKIASLHRWFDARAATLKGAGVNVNGTIMREISRSDEEVFGEASGPLDLEPWKALCHFFQRSWWRRTWIVQESTTDVITCFICGTKVLSRAAIEITVVIFLGMMLKPEFSELEKITGIELPMRVFKFRNQRQAGGQATSLWAVLEHLRTYEATDNRDKIYAGLGLASDYCPGEMPVDYGLSVAQVYIELVRYHLRKSQNLEFLSFVGCSAKQTTGLPNWAPDWSYAPNRAPFRQYIRRVDGNLEPTYKPWGPIPSTLTYGLPVIEGNRLILQGICIDSIRVAGQPAVLGLNDSSAERTWCPEDQQRIYPPTGEAVLTAFFRTLVADVIEGKSTTGIVAVSRASHVEWPSRLRHTDDLMSIAAISSTTTTRRTTMKHATSGRRFAITDSGYIGLIPSYATTKDQIWALAGGNVLFVLRKRPKSFFSWEDTQYEFIGECYIHGMMDGEAVQLVSNCRAKVQSVILV